MNDAFDALPVIQTLGQKLGIAEANLAIAQAQNQALRTRLAELEPPTEKPADAEQEGGN